MNCPECGQESQSGARFCVKCGHPLSLPRSQDTSELEPSALAQSAPAADAGDDHHATSPIPHDAQTREFSPQDFLVLIVEDTLDNLVLMSLQVQGAGYRVMTATNGEEALKVSAITPPDLILMDIAMPELDGLAATRRLREQPELRDTPVVAVTAFDTDGFRRAAYDAGIDGYLTKPVDFDRLHNLIRKLLPVR